MSSPLPSNMAMTTVRGRYGKQDGGQYVPIVGMQVRFAPAYPFVTNTTAVPSPMVIATSPKTLQTDSEGYLSDPEDGFTVAGVGVNRNAKLVSSDDPDITPHDWPYLVTFHGPGATNFRAFRTPLQSEAIVDIATLTPQRVAPGTAPTQAEIAAANAAASAAAALDAVSSIRRGQAGGVAALDADGDVNNAAGVKVLPGGGGGGGNPDLANITGMSNIGKQIVATLIGGNPASATAIRGILGAGTGNSNLVIGTASGTAADAALTNTALTARALDSQVVKTTGDQNVAGVKNFTDAMTIIPATASTSPVTKAQLDTAIAGVGGITAAPVVLDFLDSLTALEARTAIGAGTSNLAIGTSIGTAADGGVVAGLIAAGSSLPATVGGTHDFTGAITHSGATTFTSTVSFVDGSIAQADIAGLVQALADLKANSVQRIKWNGTGYPAEVAGYGMYWYYGPIDQPPSSFGRTLRDGDIFDGYAP